jgi:hypothetical protein
MSGPATFLRNAMSGDYGPVERLRRIVGNLGRRRPQARCCGNYGDPGC